LERNAVRVRVSAANVATRAGVLDHDVLDRVPSYVIIAAKISSRAKETPERAIIQGGQGFGER
jgi:hypothetical protein